jgi:hypothetical protein
MTQREKLGFSLLVAFLAALLGLFTYLVWSPGPSRGLEDSVIVQQRIINLRK